MNISNRVSKNLFNLRRKRSLKYSYISKNTGIDEDRLRRIVLGKAKPSYEELYKLSRLFDITIDDIVFKKIE